MIYLDEPVYVHFKKKSYYYYTSKNLHGNTILHRIIKLSGRDPMARAIPSPGSLFYGFKFVFRRYIINNVRINLHIIILQGVEPNVAGLCENGH